MQETKTRVCMKCKQEKEIHNFQRTQSPYFPGKRSMICTQCLEKAHDPTNLDAIDRLCRYLDLPFDINQWMTLYKTYGKHTLTAYFEMLADDRYDSVSWKEENERWKIAKQQQTIDEEIEVLSKAKIKELQNRWSSDYSKDELLFLENFYNKILATQNVSTPILQEYARDLCEIQLRIKKGLRAGTDVKKDMDARDNIIKMAKFEASNSKNSADFDSVAELMLYYGRKGFHPKWHSEPQDSVDFCMKNIQSYLQRLVSNEGSLRDQIEEKRKIFNTTQRIEEMSDDEFQVEEEKPIEYEDEDEAAKELSDWNG